MKDRRTVEFGAKPALGGVDVTEILGALREGDHHVDLPRRAAQLLVHSDVLAGSTMPVGGRGAGWRAACDDSCQWITHVRGALGKRCERTGRRGVDEGHARGEILDVVSG